LSLLVHRHFLSRRLHNPKETLFDIRDPNMLFIGLPEGSDIPYHVEQEKGLSFLSPVDSLLLLRDFVSEKV